MKLLSFGDCLAPGLYELSASFRRSAVYRKEADFLFVVARAIGRGPLNLVVEHLPVRPAQRILVTPGHVSVEGRTIALPAALRFDSRLAIPAWKPRGFASRRQEYRRQLLKAAPPESLARLLFRAPAARPPRRQAAPYQDALAARIREALSAFAGGHYGAGTRLLKGCGPGFTPAGDDFLAGMLIGWRLLEGIGAGHFEKTIRTVLRSARGGNPVSNTFLRLAANGRVMAAVQRLARALAAGPRDRLVEATGALCRFGHSSGADLGTGLLWTLMHYSDGYYSDKC